jgi:hypothetical protein
MNNLELVSVLEIAVFGLAIAQMLTILLTVRRERDVKELRELVEDQRLRLVELRAWLAGRSASQSRRTASESERDPEPTADVKASESGMPPQETRAPEDNLARSAKALEWQHEVAGRLQEGFKWFKDDPNEPREIVDARQSLAAPPRTSNIEVERTLRAIKTLKEETENTGLSREPAANEPLTLSRASAATKQ